MLLKELMILMGDPELKLDHLLVTTGFHRGQNITKSFINSGLNHLLCRSYKVNLTSSLNNWPNCIH